MFFFDHLTQQDIAKKLYISQQYVSKAINKQKQILIKNLRK
jgi:DNA-directed RNA polymerase specialized sigma subunit